MATDPFDFEVELFDTGVDFESPFVPERSTFSDFFHGLWAGIGETADIFGRGVGSETLQDVGEYIKGTSYAKPDISEYLGVQSQKSKVATGAGAGLPLSATFVAGGAGGVLAGGLAGPIGATAGGIAGTSAVGAAFARGLYDKVYEETSLANPDMAPEDVDSYAKKYVAIETLTELADTGVSLVAGKVAGKLTGNAVKAGLKTGLLSLDDIIGASAKRIGAKQMAGAILGDMAVSGGSEVLAENLQYKLDQEYDIDSEVPDYLTTFLIGAAISGPLGGSAVISEKRTQDKIRQNIEKGLSHEDVDVRKNMALQVSENLGKVSTEAQTLWDDYVQLQLDKGPLSLTDPDLLISTAKVDKLKSERNIENLEKLGIINRLDRVKRAVEPEVIDIVEKPEEILKEAGIPTGPMNPAGKGIAPPGVSAEPAPVVSSPTEPQWKQDLPLSQKELNAKMKADVEAYQEEEGVPETKITQVPTKETTKAKAEPERKATDLTAQWKKPIYYNKETISKYFPDPNDNTFWIEPEPPKVDKAARLAELEAKGRKINLTERQERKVLREELEPKAEIKVTKEKPTVTVAPKAQVSDKKAKAIQQNIVTLQESIKGADVSEEEKVATERKIEKLQDKLVERDDTLVTKGETTGVDITGAKTTVSYPTTGWKRVGATGVFTNGNGVLVKRGDRKWEFLQKGTDGERVSHGFFESQKEAHDALAEGKLPAVKEEKEVKEVVQLTEPQKALVSSIDPEEVVGKALAKSPLRDDPEASGVALEAITRAAASYNPEKGASFKSWAISKAKGAVLDYSKKRAEIDRMERQETSTEVTEGSEKEGTIASATKADVEAAVPLNVEKEEKVEAAPSKSLKEVLDKHKVPAELRGQYFLDVADGKKTFESVDKELSNKKPAEEKKEGTVEPLEAEGTIRRPRAEADARKAAVTRDATRILDRLNWNKIDAIMFARETIADKVTRDKVVLEIDNLTQNTATSILDRYINGTEVHNEYKGLAGFLKKLLKDNPNKLNSLRIRRDPEAPSAYYDPNTHTVVLTSVVNTVDPTPLHEIDHAITVRELYSNPELRQEVLNLMDLVEKEAIAVGLVSQENIDKVKALQKRTGQEFKRAFKNDKEIPSSERAILYALTNEFEFMAQPFNNKTFLTFTSTIELPASYRKSHTTLKSAIKSVYDAIVNIISRIFSRPGVSVSNSVTKRILELHTELAGQDVTMWTAGQKTYGVDVLEADKAPVSMEEHYRIMKEAEVSLTETPVAWVKKQAEKIKDTIKDYGQSTLIRLGRIYQPIANSLMRMEGKISIYNREYSKQIKPFLDKYEKLTDKEKMLLDLYLMNADGTNEATIRRDKLLKENSTKEDMTKDFLKVKEMFKEVYLRRKVVGLNKTNDVPDYWHRKVIDIDALHQAMKNDGTYGRIEAQIDRDGLSKTEKEALITSFVNTGRMPKLAFRTPSSAKERQIHTVKAEWKQYYMSTPEALVSFIYENNEAIESRMMFGTTKRKQNAELRDRLYKTLESKRPESKGYNRTVKKIVELEEWLKDISDKEYHEGVSEFLAKSLTNVEHDRKLKELNKVVEELADLKVGTASYAMAIRKRNKIQKWLDANPLDPSVKGVDLSPKDQTDLVKLLRGRLTQEGMHGNLAAIRNLSLISVLGNPISALTQTADTAFSSADAGTINAIQTMFGKKIVSAQDLDLAHSLREFQNGKTAGWLDWSLRKSGFTAMDKFGKELYMNSVINKIRRGDKGKPIKFDDFKSKWEKYLEKDTEQTYNDLVAGKDTELVKLFSFMALSEVQPISLSSMPLKYLTAGNGRFWYLLKSYNIQLLNTLYKRFIYDTQAAKGTKEKAKALANASRLLVLVVLAGASADELKDFILGRGDVSTFSNRVTDNLLKIVMINKFSLQKADREGFFKSMVAGNLIPPLQVFDDPWKDIGNLINSESEATFYTLRNVPLGGKLLYHWTTNTATKSEYSMIKQNIFDDYKEGTSYGKLRKRINKYNAWARKEDKPLITFSSLRQAKKRSSVP